MTRAVMWCLLAIVATAAAVLSFAALRDLALLCGFSSSLAWLLPVVVDAGAAAGALIWLGTSSPVKALRFARTLTWLLLASSVAGNAVVHYLTAYDLRPAWWLVVLVSAVAPSVLGSTIHLAVVVSRATATDGIDVSTQPDKTAGFIPANMPAPRVLPVAPSLAATVTTTTPPRKDAPVSERPKRVTASPDILLAETAKLVAAGAGRRRIMRELQVTDYRAKKLMEQANSARVLEDA